MGESVALDISAGDFQLLALDRLGSVAQAIGIAADIASGAGFIDRVAPALIVAEPPEQLLAGIVATAANAEKAHPADLAGLAADLERVGKGLLAAAGPLQMLEAFYRVIDLDAKWLKREYSPSNDITIMADSRHLELGIEGMHPLPQTINEAEAKALERTALLAELMGGASRCRTTHAPPSADDLAATEFGYHLLERGVAPPRAFRGIGVYGFREFQTNLSLADPGDDHVRTTSVDPDLLRGVFVHIEYIDRESKNPREIEPYRMPSMKWIARTRLHVGPDAPCSVYVGRPMWDTGSVDRDMLKSVHTMSAACTGIFAYGAAECKIGIEGMTANQAVRLLRGLVGNVLRDPARQYFSAAFNINTPIVDDRGPAPVEVKDPIAIARIGIELAAAGGAEKVTWDGASEALSSRPFPEQVSFNDLVDLVHAAHSAGLETYISAGMRAEHMTVATEAGVDGVGIGTNMHYVREDASGKHMGALKPDAVRAALKFRDDAATGPLGRAAKLLARLDRLAFERRTTGGLSADAETGRQALHVALRSRNVADCETLLEKLGQWNAMPDATGHPYLARAQRQIDGTEKAGGDTAWLADVSNAARRSDTSTLGTLFATADERI